MKKFCWGWQSCGIAWNLESSWRREKVCVQTSYEQKRLYSYLIMHSTDFSMSNLISFNDTTNLCSTIESSVWFPAMMLNPRINLYQELLLCMMLIFWSKQNINRNAKKYAKTSPKGFWASKCDVGNWIFSNSWKFNGNSMGILCWITWELSMIAYTFRSRLVSYIFKVSWLFTFSKSADCLHLQSQLLFYILKVSW